MNQSITNIRWNTLITVERNVRKATARISRAMYVLKYAKDLVVQRRWYQAHILKSLKDLLRKILSIVVKMVKCPSMVYDLQLIEVTAHFMRYLRALNEVKLIPLRIHIRGCISVIKALSKIFINLIYQL